MSSFGIGLSALRASQLAMGTVGQNLANANTPGYHRQVVQFGDRPPDFIGGLEIGTGVQVEDIHRQRSDLLEKAVTQNTADAAGTAAALDASRQIEAEFTPGSGTLDALLENFFNNLQQLASQPADLAQRRVVLGSAAALAGQFNTVAGDLDRMRDGLDQQIGQAVADANSLAAQIAEQNRLIQAQEARGAQANDARDQRDQLVNQLAQLVDVRTVEQDGQLTVLAAGVPLVVGGTSGTLAFAKDSQGNATVTVPGSAQAQNVTGGKLAGLLQVRNQTLGDFRGRLDALAQELARRVDGVQAAGLGLSGPLTFAPGTRAVSSATIPLAQAGTALPVQAGTLYVSVTNQATGQRTLTAVNLDPAAQSLRQVAAALSAVPNLQAVVNPQNNTLQILAAPGFAFDFAGRLPTQPAASALTGTTVPTLGGVYTGPANDTYTFRVVGSGTVGVTPGLQLQVLNGAGSPVASLNVGPGYTPGTSLQAANGVTVALAAGTANAGDSFTTPVVAQPDTAGLLPALGLGSFFTGSTASTLAVNPDLLNNPQLLAASRTGDSGDNTNLQAMVNLRDGRFLAGGTQTFGDFYAAMVGDIGTQVKQLDQRQTTQQALGQSLAAQQQSVSGVDPNEELVNLMQYQRSFQAAAKYIDVVNTTLNDLFSIIGVTTG
ncbi:MAG TPA: flagellar hook-associated protein FlgK [Gemmataceae bacterium]|nr:flagellar hook-associated protein FlgK [Gemmataceae bacterium]